MKASGTALLITASATIATLLVGCIEIPLVPCITKAECDDSDPCTLDSCGHFEYCVFAPKPCSPKYCDPTNGVCVYCLEDDHCNDDDLCTTDTCRETLSCEFTDLTCPIGACDASTGECVSCDDDAECNDGNSCTSDRCDDTVCSNEIIMCDRGLTCQEGECLPDEHCTSQCEPTISCETLPIEDFPNLDTTRAIWEFELNIWIAQHPEQEEPQAFPFMYVGTCPATSVTFLFRNGGFWADTRFFDTASGAFLSLRGAGDTLDPICQGVNYWPEYRQCPDAVITEILAGTFYEVGQTIEIW